MEKGGNMKFINTDKAPKAIGPYSQGVISSFEKILFISGQVGIDPETGKIVQGTIEDETIRVLNNISAILESVKLKIENVVKTTIYLTDIGNFEKVNRIYADFFGNHKPARATVEVKALPKNARIEIDAIAVVPLNE